MRISATWNPLGFAGGLGMNRAGQPATQGGRSMGIGAPMRADSVSLSPQGKASSLIDTLTKQKEAIEERKNSFLSSALEDGRSMDSIQAKLETYDEQIQEIDEQITQLSATQLGAVDQENPKDTAPKTQQDRENQTMEHLMEVSVDLERVQTMDTVKTKLDGASGVLESEIKLDKTRSKDTSEKEAQLSQLQSQSMALTVEMGSQAADMMDKTQEMSDPAEQVEDVETEESPETWELGENSAQRKFQHASAQYIQMEQMTEAPQGEGSLMSASA